MSDIRTSTVALLYPGELGAAFGELLTSRGVRVVTTLRDRSAATLERCRTAKIEVIDSLTNLAKQASLVISLVPPTAAEEVAAAYCDASEIPATYVDMNSIGPELAVAIAARVTACGHEFVDGAINGLAKNLTKGGTLFLSGKRSAVVADLLGDAMRVRLLGDEIGRASSMKMLLSGLSKGLCALFVENALIARRQGMLSEMIEAYTTIYPGVMVVVDRMLPTYARHAGRRAVEMRELEETARGAGVEPCVIEAVRELHEMLAGASFKDGALPDLTALIETLDREQLLSVVRAGQEPAR